ncbi:MAG: DUF1553 domain-containing protein [Verrucomicrobia bacterium]|nr:DUF1553 domain-containing protein [Verrucomicrobiota bacterium]
MTPRASALMLVAGLWLAAFGFSRASAAGPDAAALEFFEKKVRPLLAEYCYECHSADTKTKGELRLDVRDGWAKGGESGPAITPGDLEKSLVIKAVRYTDRDLKMPPKQPLAPEEVAVLEQWVKLGAPDPRTEATLAAAKKQHGMSIEEGRKFWSFRPPQKNAPPAVKDSSWPHGEIDRFVLAKLEEKNLHPVADAERATLLRRAYYDLIGLPPTPEQTDAFLADKRPDAFTRVVDELLASPHFGERWGRHWLDVTRFAESSGGGRTLLFKDAWRFRDYVIESFNRDTPFDQFIAEQIAGDLLPHTSAEQRRRQLTATAFLSLGPTNYEEQDKGALRMDVVDEQLDTLGKAFLGLTIGCARCHDHKFDPLPAKDYYAMAGILRSTRTLFNYTDNVARWIDAPLPMDGEKEVALQAHEAQVAALKAKIDAAKAEAKKMLAGVADETTRPGKRVAVAELPGIVVDDTEAKAVGAWTHSIFSRSFVGEGYLHDANDAKGEKTLTFVPKIAKAGRYEVRLAYVPSTNRTTNAPVTVFHADGEDTVTVDETETPPIGGRFVSLGKFRFEKDGAGFVLVSNTGTKGIVNADAVQFIPEGEVATSDTASKTESKEARAANSKVKSLEAEMKKLAAAAPPRAVAMAVREEDEIGDTKIHIRGSIRNLGEKVPRGFITVASIGKAPAIPEKESGRRELAAWIGSPENPLTARVMANRVWHWLFGVGLVRTTDNFGTTGEAPSHPELLDHLAVRLVEHGWSVKKLVREVVLSRTYQLDSNAERGTQSAETVSRSEFRVPSSIDPENRLLWRQNRRRLDAESIRDTVLSVSGELKLDFGGPNMRGAGAIDANTTAAQNTEYTYVYADTRRSVYTPAFRNKRLELFDAFDFGDINAPMGRRNESTVAPQALFMLNHPFVIEQSGKAAERALGLPGKDDAARVDRAYRLTLGRWPTDAERQVALNFVQSPASEGAADAGRQKMWAQFYQMLFASVDFRFLN